MFAGIFQILHTPFLDDGTIDWDSLARQIEYSIAAQAHGLVIPAMASEFFTLSDQERFEVVAFALEHVNKRVPVLVGAHGLTQYAAVSFAEHAVERGADGIIAMPPYLRKASKAETEIYYHALAKCGLPVMIQNAPALSGGALPIAEVAALMASHELLQYVKEEAPPILQRISQVISAAGGTCKGVFGGANGMFLIDELDRGAAGNMPAGGFIDVQVKIYNLYAGGKRDEAAALHMRALPLLMHASVYGVTLHKHLLWKRGVLRSPHARDPQRINLDKHDEKAIAEYWKLIEPDTMQEYSFK